MKQKCEDCMNFCYDEEFDEYTCIVNMDEDEVYALSIQKSCPYFRLGDEYKIVHKQI